jgi:hypothetical protein
MVHRLRLILSGAVSLALFGLAVVSSSGAQGEPPPPRAGLTALQTKQAVSLAKGAMVELRKKTEGASLPDADRREYVVGVELLAGSTSTSTPPRDKPAAPREEGTAPDAKSGEPAKDAPKRPLPGPRAVVTSYRYFDDITVFTTVDLGTGRVVKVDAAQHLRTPLSETEFDEAVALARERSEPVKALFERFGDQVTVYPQFSQFTRKDDPRIHRVVHLTYRVGKRDLSYPRPEVDLSTREVETPGPIAEPAPRAPRRTP